MGELLDRFEPATDNDDDDDDDDVLFSSPEYSTEMQQSNMKHFTEEQEKQGGELVGSSGD